MSSMINGFLHHPLCTIRRRQPSRLEVTLSKHLTVALAGLGSASSAHQSHTHLSRRLTLSNRSNLGHPMFLWPNFHIGRAAKSIQSVTVLANDKVKSNIQLIRPIPLLYGTPVCCCSLQRTESVISLDSKLIATLYIHST